MNTFKKEFVKLLRAEGYISTDKDVKDCMLSPTIDGDFGEDVAVMDIDIVFVDDTRKNLTFSQLQFELLID